MDRGWIALWRKCIDDPVWANEHLWRLWSWCLLKANHKATTVSMKTGRGETLVKLQKGQFIVGRKSAGKELGWPPSSIRNRLGKLLDMELISLKADTHWSIITICNWGKYQDVKKEIGQPKDNQRTGKGQPKDTDNNDNNEENDNKDQKSGRFTPPTLEEEEGFDKEIAFEDFWTHYPKRNNRKVGKKETNAAWLKVTTGRDKALEIRLATINYAEYCSHTDTPAKDPVRFIRGAVWEDFIEVVALTPQNGGRASNRSVGRELMRKIKEKEDADIGSGGDGNEVRGLLPGVDEQQG